MQPVHFLLAVSMAGLSGCSGDPADSGAQDPLPDPSPDGNGPDGMNVTGNVEDPPTWNPGDWWDWEVTSVTTDASLDATTAVLSTGATISVGTTDVEAASEVYPFHVVPIGEVQASDLSWMAHGAPVSLLRFPLTVGDTWTSDFWSAPGADVTIGPATLTYGGPHDGFRVNVSYAGAPDSLFLQAEYSPRVGQFVRLATYFGGAEPFTEAVLVGHGTNVTGDIRPFVAQDMARIIANAGDPASMAPQTLQFPDGADRVILACFLPGEQGAYGATLALTPGEQLACQVSNPGAGDRTYHVASTPATPESVAFTPAVVGQGSANLEVFAVATTN